MNTVSDQDPADELIHAVKDVATAVREGTSAITQGLKEIDESLALLVSRGALPDATLPTPGELLERVTSLGSRVVMKAVTDWEKRSGLTSD